MSRRAAAGAPLLAAAAVAALLAAGPAAPSPPLRAAVFWNSMCQSCVDEAPQITAWLAAHPGVQATGYAFMETHARARSFAATQGWTFPVQGDPQAATARRLGVKTLDTLVLLRGDRVLRRIVFPWLKAKQAAASSAHRRAAAPSLTPASLADPKGRPALVAAFDAKRGAAALAAFRKAAAPLAARVRAVAVVCGKGAAAPAGGAVRVIALPACAPALDSAFDGLAAEAAASRQGVAARVVAASGSLLRLHYEEQVALYATGVDAGAPWTGLVAGMHDPATIFPAFSPAPRAAVGALPCASLPRAGAIVPTCTYDLSGVAPAGTPVVLVAFGKTCPSCHTDTGPFEYQRWADAHPGVQLVGITCDDPVTAYLWARERGWKFPVLASGSAVLKGGFPDYTGCFNTTFARLHLNNWGDVAAPRGGVDLQAFARDVGLI